MVITPLRVRYAETDKMSFVHHANYLVWFELGRSDWMRSKGVPYPEFEARGIFVPVIEARCRYHAPAHYDEEVAVESRLQALSPTRITFAYCVRRGERRLAEGSTEHAFIDARGRPVSLKRAQPELWAQLQQLFAVDASG